LKFIVLAFCVTIPMVAAAVAYARFAQAVKARLRQGPTGTSISLYAAPHRLTVSEVIDPGQVAAELRISGYSESTSNPAGHYRIDGDRIEIYPGPRSFFRAEPARVWFHDRRVARITAVTGNEESLRYSLEPQLLFDLSGEQRQKRRRLRFDQIPKVLIDAVLAAEDKHFFLHMGVDPVRILKAAYVNMKSGQRKQGGSTLTMQLARSLWLDSRKNWKRKAMEGLIAFVLERKLSKKEIFEYYSNQIYLGEHETFSIHGFGEAARIYFNKDVDQITLPEAAFLAGIIQRPSFFDPTKHPERGIARRNVVLALMRQNGYIDGAQEKSAAISSLGMSPVTPERGEAPYYLALAMDEFRKRPETTASGEGSFRVYTTLDLSLQRAAVEAVRMGMRNIDDLLSRKRGKWGHGARPQVALIALDAHTGEVKAVVGGRDYGASQINHALAKRQPGSVFKPFVYAAAVSDQAEGEYRFTASSMLDDTPTVFRFGKTVYEPNNFGDRFYGRVTLRKALAKSMNVATVSLAERIGYNRVAELARNAGLNEAIQATPAVALGAYEASPLEMAGAYTVFANEGIYVKPEFIAEVQSGSGELIYRSRAEERTVLDPKVAFLMRNLLEEVVQSGTAVGVRTRGLRVPVAGKTGTSHDGWFAGFTSNLLCVVWVGFDDNSELNLEGARSALPIWTEFMKRATQNPYFAAPFEWPPVGIVAEQIDPESGLLAGALCPESRTEYFIAGSEPQGSCPLHGGPGSIEEAGFAKRFVDHPSVASAIPLDNPTDSASQKVDTGRLSAAREPEFEKLSGKARETGRACFFPASATGGLTASGSRLNSEELVAAHPWFPMGSWVRVRNLANGKIVDVRVVDRFPGRSGRVINVSEAAAKALSFIKAGTVEVELTIIEGTSIALHE
jgi:penicillin-binding protein 1B